MFGKKETGIKVEAFEELQQALVLADFERKTKIKELIKLTTKLEELEKQLKAYEDIYALNKEPKIVQFFCNRGYSIVRARAVYTLLIDYQKKISLKKQEERKEDTE